MQLCFLAFSLFIDKWSLIGNNTAYIVDRSGTFWFQIVTREDLLLFFVFVNSELTIFGFETVGQTISSVIEKIVVRLIDIESKRWRGRHRHWLKLLCALKIFFTQDAFSTQSLEHASQVIPERLMVLFWALPY